MKRVIIDIKEDGSISLDALGFSGAECEKATKAIEEALGKAVESKRKPDYYARQNVAGRAGVHRG